MAKKVITALLALTMCAGLAGCGNVESSSKETSKDNASDSVNETSVTGDEDTEQPADSKADVTSEDGSIKLTEIKQENILYHDTSDYAADKPTMEEILMFSQLAAEQYTAAQAGDAEKFKQTLNYDKMISVVSDDTEGDISLRDEIVTSRIKDLIDNMDYEIDRNETVMKMGDLAERAYENFDPDRLEYSIWTKKDSLYPLDEIDDDTVLHIILNYFTREEDAMEMSFDMVIYSGEYSTRMGSIYAWSIDGEIGVNIGSAQRGNNDYAGMTGEEIQQFFRDRASSSVSELIPKKIYNCVRDYCTEKEEAGEDIRKALETNFPQCSSSAGLDLAAGEPEAEGDRMVRYEMGVSEIYDGTVSFGPFDDETGMIEAVIYITDDGTVWIYPDLSEE
jgi:hypothetical protein